MSEEDWAEYGYLCIKANAAERIKLRDDFIKADTLVNFNIADVTLEHYDKFITNVQQIVEDVEELGDYEYGPFRITVSNKLNHASEKIVVNNPDIKPEHLYTIH